MDILFIWNGCLFDPTFTTAKKPSMRKAIIIDIIAALFVILFTYAAISKFSDYHKFKIQLSQSPLLTSFAGLTASAIPTIELAVAILLIQEKYRQAALIISICLMAMFTTYIITITNYSTYIPCSCGGILQNMNWNQHLLFNLLFLIMGVLAVLLYSTATTSIALDKKNRGK